MKKIERKMESKVSTSRNNLQVSVNSDDCICLRFWNDDNNSDDLYCLTQIETRRIIDFVKKYCVKADVRITANLDKPDLPF